MADAPETLLSRGYEARREHRLADAREIFAEAVQHYRETGEQNLLARALTGLGQIERDMAREDAALLLYEEAAAIYRSLGDPLRLAHTIRHVGDILRKLGKLDHGKLAAAEACYAEALRIYREHAETSPLDLANTLRGFALLRGDNGDEAGAALLWREAGDLYAAVNVQAGVDESERRLAFWRDRRFPRCFRPFSIVPFKFKGKLWDTLDGEAADMSAQVAETDRSWVVTEEKVWTALNRLIEAADPVKIIAFGSRARGTPQKESDLDLAIILQGNSSRPAKSLWAAVSGLRLPVDLITTNEAIHERFRKSINSVHHDIAEQGVVLYQKGVHGSPDRAAIAKICDRREHAAA
jgi:uncharacterized protein